MRFPRSSGILLHPTSLPGGYGIGCLGAEARAFADWLAAGGQKLWQVLPLGPTGYRDSPYQLFSAFAGNPLLIDLEALVQDGLLDETDLARAPVFPQDEVKYGTLMRWKLPLLAQAAARFLDQPPEDYADFCQRHAAWLDDFALFMALKDEHGGAMWTKWDRGVALRDPAALDAARGRLAGAIEVHKFSQYIFFRQWMELKAYCRERGIRIVGDMPIYVAHDSADVWANRELFQLDADGNPSAVAGVPPDYFSATGQLWGNPLYRWDVLHNRGYGWWIDRFRHAFGLVDYIRLDHFRGFEAYWAVPAGEATAINGQWLKGPGAGFFDAVQAALGELPLIAENLGVITPEVESLRERFGFPGMAILQFAFGKDPQAPDFRPHNYPRHLVAYSGTHDNDTTLGWWNSQAGTDSTRTAADIEEERAFALRYLATDGREMNWVFIRTLMASVADAVVFPMQDVLGLGSEARMNLPGSLGRYWRWRFRRGAATPELAARLRGLAETYDR
ncbi:MAG: 4-alpha-glucanotransferase [bacterium]